MRILTLLALLMTLALADDSAALFRAIRNGDLPSVKTHATKEELAARDKRGATPLMHAAAFGNVETVKLLIEAGADVNAKNDFDATALLWAARNPEKARLLIAAGADVNAMSKQGRTPLMVASMRRGNAETVKLMLDKGGDPNVSGGRFKGTSLHLAGIAGDPEIIRLLLSKGANPQAVNLFEHTPLIMAPGGQRAEAVKLLIAPGVDVNHVSDSTGLQRAGPSSRARVSALHDAAGFGPVQSVRELLEAGAKVNARDGRELTPLHFALASELPSLETVKSLLAAGADINARDNFGETPLDWAEKFGYPDIIAALKKAGARNGVAYQAPKHPDVPKPTPAMAVTRAVKLLEASSAEFFAKSGCVACHHQAMVARAQHAAKSVGVVLNEPITKEQAVQMRTQWITLQEEFLQNLNPGGGANRLAETLLGFAAAGIPADSITDSAVVDMAEAQEIDGSWRAEDIQLRPPMMQSGFAGTARVIRALQAYPIPARQKEFTERIARARAWLEKATPVTTEDYASKLSGLTVSGASENTMQSAAKALLALQRPGGGWAGNPYLQPDAFATANALVALAESKALKVSDPAYQRGVDYLLSTQFPDGSWHVRSRAIKFQPYFESGFPHGHDQWISIAATTWAVQALTATMRRP